MQIATALGGALSAFAVCPIFDFLVRAGQAPTCFSLYQCARFPPG